MTIIDLDFAAMERRVAAEIAVPAQGIDVPTEYAANLFHIPVSEVTKSQRSYAKTILHGVLY